MRLLHTADWHLGKIIYGKSMLKDQRSFIYDFFLPLVDSKKPDAVMISGDVFDRSIAPVEAIRLFDDFVDELCIKRKTKLLVSVGNHDGADRFSLGAKLLCNSGFYISSRLDKDITPVTLHSDDCTVNIYMLPFFDAATARDVMQDDTIASGEDAFKAVIGNIADKLDNNAVNIVMAHCYVTGARVSEELQNGYIGSLEPLNSDVFAPFDYVALGHLHEQQLIGGAKAYSGSPLKYSFDEERQKKGVFVLDINNGKVEITPVPITPLHDMRTMQGEFDELIKAAETDSHRNDYLFARIIGMPVFEPMAKLKEHYPNILGLVNGEDYTQTDDERAGLRDELRRTKPDKVKIFSSFMSQICSADVTDDDIELFRQIAEEVGGEGR